MARNPGLETVLDVLPLPRLLVRILIVTLGLLALVRPVAIDLVRAMLPLFTYEVTTLDPDFRVLAIEIDTRRDPATLRLRANLAHPLQIEGQVLEPFGAHPYTEGWYQVNLSALGVLQGTLVMLIAVLAWPAARRGELSLRALLALPCLAVLLLTDTPLELLGNLQHVVVARVDRAIVVPLFMWDRFLEGGGNIALALFAALVTIAVAARCASTGRERAPSSATADSGGARPFG